MASKPLLLDRQGEWRCDGMRWLPSPGTNNPTDMLIGGIGLAVAKGGQTGWQ